MFSNRYIFIFASVMVFFTALILSLAATLLQPFQQKNLDIEKMKGILHSATITGETQEIPSLYSKYIVKEIVVDIEGNENSVYSQGKFEKGNIRAFDINLKEQLTNQMKTGNGLFPIFIVGKDNLTYYVIPLLGRGLWGPIWGDIALSDDINTVVGVTFDHKSETPGLGAEITTDKFQQQFVGKMIFDEQGKFQSVKVVKGGIKNNPSIPEIHGVDAISGGSITSSGTSEMLRSCLTNYLKYFEKIKQNGKQEQ